jgi:hypothetical protein
VTNFLTFTNRHLIYGIEGGVQLSLLDATLFCDVNWLDLARAQRNH